MTAWLATILIFLPLGGALFIWLLPVGRVAGSIALLVALTEVGFWINALTRMDFDRPGRRRTSTSNGLVQRPQRLLPRRLLCFSFWLAGLAVVVMAAAIAYGYWVGRERPRAYFGLCCS